MVPPRADAVRGRALVSVYICPHTLHSNDGATFFLAAPPALAPATASSPSLVHDRCERLRSYGAEVDERVALLIELANDRNVIPSQHREPERFQLHAILHAKNALVRLVEDHVRRLIEALQQTLWCEQRRRRRIGKGIVAGRRTREGGMGAAAAAAARRMRKW